MRPLLGRSGSQASARAASPSSSSPSPAGALFLLAYLSLAVLPLNTDPSVATPSGAPGAGSPTNLWLDGWTRWDAGWYRHIATHGYVDQAVGPRRPAEPRVLPPVSPDHAAREPDRASSPLAAGILVSNLAFLAR